VPAILASRYFWPLAAVAVALVASSPAVALVLGALLALVWGNPRVALTGKLAKYLLQAAVVLLGFGLQLGLVLKVGASSLGITFFSITLTLALGFGLSYLFRVGRELTTLLSSGTAICGGSAIAAIAPAIGASPANTALSLAIVFLLNAVALVVFPYVGQMLDLSQEAFGLWSALAIHDTSSVVGATAIYGEKALAVGTTVKLTRALWILPLSFVCSRLTRHQSGAKTPWFLGGFLLAALVRSSFGDGVVWWDRLADVGRFLMVATLFLIGGGLTRASLRQIGLRPFFMAVVLWLTVAGVSLAAVSLGWINLSLPL
jgi:uncharacterized integral membrane protein (TIGR00698 family)